MLRLLSITIQKEKTKNITTLDTETEMTSFQLMYCVKYIVQSLIMFKSCLYEEKPRKSQILAANSPAKIRDIFPRLGLYTEKY